MQEHELTMRKMVEEIHRGVLNIEQAAAKFEVTRKTVRHRIDRVENVVQVQDLLAKVCALEEELQASKFTALYYSSLVK